MKKREIKFRVWNSAKKEWFVPVYEAYKGNLYDLSISTSGQVIERTMECCADIRNEQDYEISQFTGLLDKNGKEIYEGDHTRTWEYRIDDNLEFTDELCNEEVGTVFFDEKLAGYVYKTNGPLASKDVFEVIGNIHEHPQLLNPQES